LNPAGIGLERVSLAFEDLSSQVSAQARDPGHPLLEPGHLFVLDSTVVVCPSCGAQNREEARFCDSCGAPFAEAPPVREARKTVTVFFCDVSGSTALGERIDPESLRRVMARYFETAKTIVERHGGTVEKFIGDAVMAVFGIPAVHEDDALRAVRAAAELRDGLAPLNDELAEAYGTSLELRMGVNTGEVVTGTEERLATGDAVNVAARLEQAAQPGEVLLGAETHGLVRGAVEVEPAPPVEAKGKAQPVPAFRLLAVRDEASAVARRHGAPMVGRVRQRKQLEGAFASVAGERSCHLFTVLGTAGVGKSRLVEEFLRSLDGATVVRGRCLSYGEGISYWPVTEVVKQLLTGSEDEAAAALATILGDEHAASSPEEIAWAFRKLLEARAAERPLVVVFEDIHWGEPTFLDLVEHVADLSRDAPILLLCMARPELLDGRPAWGGGMLNATNVLIEPLGLEESGELIGALTDAIPDELRERILEAAGGNPLFVEEMLAMVAEDGGEVSVPPTIQALLAARLDQLDPAERGVLERGAVEGQVFHRGAVAALAPEEPTPDSRLMTLVRKDLVRPEAALLVDEEAYRFRHLLIRDTAYEALPKATRAELHERFAAWLGEHGADLVELDEIVGYHLEQAYRYRQELGPLDAADAELAAAAGARLVSSADRARVRGDVGAAESLLRRAGGLLPVDGAANRSALLDLAAVLVARGRFPEAARILDELVASAEEAGDERVAARAELVRLELAVEADPTMTIARSFEAARAAASVLERVGDEEGVAWAERLIGNFHWWTGKTGDAQRVWSGALERAERVSPRLVIDLETWVSWSFWEGPVPTEEGIRRCDEMIARRSGNPLLEGNVLIMRGSLNAMRADFEAARADIAAGRGLLREIGHLHWWAGTSMVAADVELLAGEPQTAADVLLEGYELMSRQSATGFLATVVGMRAYAAQELGQDEEALRLVDETLQLAAKDDFEPQARSRCIRGVVLAKRGEVGQADEHLREAERIVAETDYLPFRAMVAMKRAEAARFLGRADEERAALEQALSLAEQKQDLVTAAKARVGLAALPQQTREVLPQPGHGPRPPN
jgi:class 3 adenylate cyclase/tetratricopeptide (TPR) repeat protein